VPRTAKASQAQSKLKQIERIGKNRSARQRRAQNQVRVPQPQRSGLKVVTLKGDQSRFRRKRGLSRHEFSRGARPAHRSGRTERGGQITLLKILAGVLQFQSGTRELGHNVKAGYYSQYRVEMLQPERTVFEEALDTPQRVTEQFIRTVLGCFLFRGDDVLRK